MSQSGKTRVLIVDDEEPVRRQLGRLLEGQGYGCLLAADAAAARRCLEEEAFALMLCDVRMPGESGLDLIREVLPTKPDMAVILVTAVDDAEVATTVLELGAYGYVVKPFRHSELLINVANALRRRTLELEAQAQQKRLEQTVWERTADLREVIANLERTQRELQQAEKLAALGTLLSGLAHELNNPLFAISGYAQMALEQVTQGRYEGLAEDLAQVRTAAKRAIAVVDRFLRQARPADGRFEPCEVNTLLKQTLDLMANDFTIHQIQVHTQFHSGPAPIFADPQALTEVFLNLFTNARHAMVQAHGRGTLTVETTSRSTGPDKDHLEIRVTDDGPGIAPDQLTRIFDPFFTTKPAGEGTGLGLFVSHQIVTELAGTLTCESALGSGTTFIIQLPVRAIQRTEDRGEGEQGGRHGENSAGG